MNTSKSFSKTDVYLPFASLLAPLVAAQLGGSAELTPELAAEDLPVPTEAGTLTAVLHFDGALAGKFLACCTAPDAATLGAGDEADPHWLTGTLAGCSDALEEALFSRYGKVKVRTLEGEDATPPQDTTPVAVLTTAEGARILLFADPEFELKLKRLARVAAAAEASGITHGNLGLVMDVELEVTLRFGQRQLSLREVLDLGSGSVVELDSDVDEPVELMLDGRVIARGEAVIVEGNYGVRITEVLHRI